jgi:hypothetical protein
LRYCRSTPIMVSRSTPRKRWNTSSRSGVTRNGNIYRRITMAALQNLAPTVVIRAARGSDGPALRRLAALDSADLPAGELLIAEADDHVVAAMSLETGAKVADPFRRTAEVVDLLAFRAKRLRAA